MKPIKNLAEVTIKANLVEMEVKKDTLEYNAAAFKTRPNAVVEDILKKLPGIEIQSDGSIQAQGKTVKNIYVDGKKFFSNDPQAATKNFPAESVDKIQVFDKKSDIADFTGIDDGVRETTINIKLKPNFKKGTFGYGTAGYGTDNRFDMKSNVNDFKGERQISLLRSGNNVNKASFSAQDNGSVANGHINLWGIGGNYNDQFNKKTDLNLSYFYYNRNSLTEQYSTRSYYQPGNTGGFSQFTDINQNYQRLTGNHKLNLTLEHKLDSMNNLKFTGYFTSTADNTNNNQLNINKKADSIPVNNSHVNTITDQTQTNITTNLLWRHRFEAPGRFFTLSGSVNYSGNHNQTGLNSQISYFNPNYIDSVLQSQPYKDNRWDYDAAATFTEPMGKYLYSEFNYNFHLYTDNSDKKVYNLLNGETTLNDTLTNRLDYQYVYNRGGMNFRYAKEEFQASAGMSIQQSQLSATYISSNTFIRKNWIYPLPKVFLQYSMGRARNFRLEYTTNVNEPSVTQLQPVVNNIDPLNLYVGNPDLKPEYQHSFNGYYQSFNMNSGIHLMLRFNSSYTLDKIVSARNTDSQLRSTYRSINVPNDFSSSMMVNFGYRMKKPLLRTHFRGSTSYNRSIVYVNNVENFTNLYGFTGGVRLGYEIEDIFEINGDARLNYNIAEYSVSTKLNSSYLNQTYSIDGSLKLPLNFQFVWNTDFNVYNGSTGFTSRNVYLVGAGLSKFIFDDNRGEIKLSVTDLLNQNTGIIRNNNAQYIENGYINSLGRYVMLSFTYKVKRFKGDGKRGERGERGEHGPGGGGRHRMRD
jgi:hypothetical protein